MSPIFHFGSPLWRDDKRSEPMCYTLLDVSIQLLSLYCNVVFARRGIDNRRGEFTILQGPTQPAFLYLQFGSHDDAWIAYRLLSAHPDTPGYISWVFTKHHR